MLSNYYASCYCYSCMFQHPTSTGDFFSFHMDEGAKGWTSDDGLQSESGDSLSDSLCSKKKHARWAPSPVISGIMGPLSVGLNSSETQLAIYRGYNPTYN